MSKKDEKSERNKLRKFLEELTELTKKYGIEIGGCGECGSPWVITPDKENLRKRTWLEHLYFCRECGMYGAMNDHEGCR